MLLVGRQALIRGNVKTPDPPGEHSAEGPSDEDIASSEPDELEADNPLDLRPDAEQLHHASSFAVKPVRLGTTHPVPSQLIVKCFGGLQVVSTGRVLWPARELAQEQRAWELSPLRQCCKHASRAVSSDPAGAATASLRRRVPGRPTG
jgi:hypothetical protein